MANGKARTKARAKPEEPQPLMLDEFFVLRSVEAEQWVLGAILLEPSILDDVAAILRPEDFYLQTHRMFYESMLSLNEQGAPVDIVSLADHMTQQGVFEGAGGDATLGGFLASVPHAANALYHAEIVRRKRVNRDLITVSEETIASVHQVGQDLTEEALLAEAEERLFAIGERSGADAVLLPDKWVDLVAKRITDRQNQEYQGLETGFRVVDEMLNGLHPGQLVIVGARPSMGKTALAIAIADHIGVAGGKDVLMVSLEMAAEEVGERFVVARGGIDGNLLRAGHHFDMDQEARYLEAIDQLRASRFAIDPGPSRTVTEIAAGARRHKRKQGLDLLIVDYLQLVSEESFGRREVSRQEAVAQMTRRLKMLARGLNVPVLCLSQINRQVEARVDKRPLMSDLRESGAIENDADVVLLLHRPEYYDINDRPGVAEVIVAKNRNGAVGVTTLHFARSLARFTDLPDYTDAAAIEAYQEPS
jgi:replicative DNA helicase